MAATHGLDPAAHIGPGFRDAFPTWRGLTAYLAAHATTPAFDTDRATRQLLMTDLLARLTAIDGFDWILRGSLALPLRPTPRTASPRATISAVHRTARPAFDIDLCATTITRGDQQNPANARQQLRTAAEQVIDTGNHSWARHGVGLGGLVHYSSRDLRLTPRGRVVGQISAQPLDPRRSSTLQLIPSDDPISVHIDLSPPGSSQFAGEPERPHRPLLAIAVPGFADIRPDLYPTANQIADKLALIATPHWNPPWHRFKDLFDMHYLITQCHITAGELRTAIAANPNLARHGLGDLPNPYRLHGHQPRVGADQVQWEAGYQRQAVQHPALAVYPDFSTVLDQISALADQLPETPDSAVWNPSTRRWTQPTASKRPRHLPPPGPPDPRRPSAQPPAPTKAVQREDHARRTR